MSEIVIIGGGLAGLAAAYRLADDHQVTLIEKDKLLGGMLKSYHIEDYYIEIFYHHFFASDTELIELIEELGLAEHVLWLTATTGYYWEGKAYPMSTPIEILRFPPLSIIDVLRLSLLVLRTKFIKDIGSYDNITAKEWIIKTGGKSVYNNFFQPLLQSKFGQNADRVSAAWLLGRVKIRSNRGTQGEKLGYLNPGFNILVEALAQSIQEKGGRIIRGNQAESIITKYGEVTEVKLVNGTISCNKVISTVAPGVLKKLIDPKIIKLDLDSIQYQGTCCAILGITKPLMKEGTYWLNINADVSFGALIEHTNFMSPKNYGDQHLVYIASYFQNPDDPLFTDSPDKVIDMFLKDVESLYPDFDRKSVIWWRLARDSQTAPVYDVGYADKVLPYATKIKGLYLAGMFSEANYPERSMNGSIKAGFEVADAAARDM